MAVVRIRNVAAVSREFAISEDALARHLKNHLPRALVQALPAKQLKTARDILDNCTQLLRELEEMKDKLEKEGDYRGMLLVIDQLRKLYEFLLRVFSELRQDEDYQAEVRANVYEVLKIRFSDFWDKHPDLFEELKQHMENG